ncbi:hypothetical protein AB6A40_001776 [Gnathostoma spinigerum]|uniref:Uncharacterized protein n=1 Tax=Gnathostoma spinigerum TaxID=75299 RepID=A0ABD6EEX2_9BILA
MRILRYDNFTKLMVALQHSFFIAYLNEIAKEHDIYLFNESGDAYSGKKWILTKFKECGMEQISGLRGERKTLETTTDEPYDRGKAKEQIADIFDAACQCLL